MELHQARYFLAVCDDLNFTRAAGKCNVSQPSLTRAIQTLEKEFGGNLFDRKRSSIELTDLGKLHYHSQDASAEYATKSVGFLPAHGKDFVL